MPFNGAGVYSPPGADFPAVTQTVISSTHYNNIINDIATGLSLCLTKDGQQTATANIPFGGFRATNVGITAIAGSVGTPAINVSDSGTGLYRSAASELAVTIAGTQRARFDATGLIVTGVGTFSGATSTTTLTATTSVVTPLISSSGDIATDHDININTATTSNLKMGGATILTRVHATGNITLISGGGGGTVTLDSFASPTTIKVSGNTIATFNSIGTTANNLKFENATAGNDPVIRVEGEANISMFFSTVGTGIYKFNTGGGRQLELLNTTSTRNITITGSNGGNPTIGVTAGSLAITPAVVIAGASIQIGTNSSSVGPVGVPYGNALCTRNNANTGDIVAVLTGSLNGVADIVSIGVTAASNGVRLKARSGGAAPTTSDLLPGEFTVWRDTGGATTKLYYNNAGAIQSIALA